MRLNDKAAVTTGGNRGIGLATAHEFVNHGARVAIFGRNQPTLQQAAGKLGPNALAVEGDVPKLGDIDRLSKSHSAAGRSMSWLQMRASPSSPRWQPRWKSCSTSSDIVLKGVFFAVRKALPFVVSSGMTETPIMMREKVKRAIENLCPSCRLIL